MPIFFIGIGRSMKITGPFKVTGEPTLLLPGPRTVGRLEETDPCHGVYTLNREQMPWSVPFKPLIPSIDKELEWNDVAKEFGINQKKFKTLISVNLLPDQIDWLKDKLLEINS